VKHGVLKTFHPMIGRDLHIPWPPGSPSPAPSPVPYYTFAPMIGFTGFMSTYASDFYSHYHGLTMLKVTDIGAFIPHIGPPSQMILLDILLSSSKSYFGSSRFKSKNKPIAVSLAFVVNPNLNCGTPVPTPTGCVLCITTHRVDMTWGDIFAGLLQMCCDIAVQWAISKLGLKPGTKMFNAVASRIVRGFQGKGLQGAEFILALDKTIALATSRGNAVTLIATAVVGFFTGSPMGVDAGGVGLYGKNKDGENRSGPIGALGNLVSDTAEDSGQTLGRYLDGGNPNGYPKEFGPGGETP